MAAKKKNIKRKKSGKKTYVAVVLDRSGSMSSIHRETVEGINKQFAAVKKSAKLAGDTKLSLIQFDDHIDVVLDAESPDSLKEWSDADFVPRGMTALYDGIWSAINHLKTKPVTDDTAYLICVISDGGENASKEVNQEHLAAEIKKLQDQGNWTFTYLMANVDIKQMAQTLSVSNLSNISAYTTNNASATYTVASNSMESYLNMRETVPSNTINSSFYAFSEDDKKKLVATK